MLECSMNVNYVRVRIPYLYPDGDFIDFFSIVPIRPSRLFQA
jgi:hypothetical protein